MGLLAVDVPGGLRRHGALDGVAEQGAAAVVGGLGFGGGGGVGVAGRRPGAGQGDDQDDQVEGVAVAESAGPPGAGDGREFGFVAAGEVRRKAASVSLGGAGTGAGGLPVGAKHEGGEDRELGALGGFGRVPDLV
jgi:hypothetical protein